MTPRPYYYAYIIDTNENDYVTTSYEVSYEKDYGIISVFSFHQEDISGYEYVVIDTTMSNSFYGAYSPKKDAYKKNQFFKIFKKEHDVQRGTLDLFVRSCEEFDIFSYRRDNRIRKVIEN